MSAGGVSPFSSGSQFGDWQERNCRRCTKYDEETFRNGCDIDLALFEAWAGDGEVSEEIGRRMGLLPDNELAYTWDCPERRPR